MFFVHTLERRDGWSFAWSWLQPAQDWESTVHREDRWEEPRSPTTQINGWKYSTSAQFI